jgi:hypothetical protein
MTDDKRPKPFINLRPPRREEPPRLSAGHPGGGTGPGMGAAPPFPGGSPGSGGARGAPPPPPARSGGALRFAGYLLAGVAGSAITASALILLPTVYPGIVRTVPQLAAFVPYDIKGEVRRLEDRTAEVERAVRAQAATRQDAPGAEAVNELRGRLDQLVRRVSDLDIVVAQGEFGGKGPRAATSADAQAEAERAVAPAVARIAALEREVDGLIKAQAERQGDAKAAALTLALSNLKRAVADGRPYASELATVESLAPRKLPVGQLAPHKDSGVPTFAVLSRDFGDFTKRAIERHYQGDSSTFIGDMIARARSAIQVRPAGGNGDTPEAVLGRMGAALRAGELGTALVEAGGLSGRAAEEMQPWVEAARNRVTVDAILKQTDEELLAALTKTGVRR